MSGNNRGIPGPVGRRIEHDAGVSEIIGAVLLIALVVAGGTLVGVALFSQPFPTQTPKVNIVIGADESGTVTLVHNGGEALNPGQYQVYLNQTLWNQSYVNNNTSTPADTTAWSVGNSLTLRGSDANLTDNVTVVYSGSSGNVTITSVNAVGTGGAGYGFFSSLFEYILGKHPEQYPEGIVPLPTRQVTHYKAVPSWPANMSPQINFTPNPDTRIYIYVQGMTTQAEIDEVKSAYPDAPVEAFSDANTINDALVNYGRVILLDGTYNCEGPIRCIQSYRILEAYHPGMAQVPMHSGGYSDGYIKVSAPNMIISGLNLYGTGGVEIVTSNVSIQNVNVTSRELGYTPDPNEPPSNKAPINGMFFVWADGQNIDNVEFYNCTARECNTHGWNMNQNWNGVAYTISNTRFVNCRASYCGYGATGDLVKYNDGSTSTVQDTNQSRSEWITGFDLHEWQDLVGCHVYNCTADNNWESGFHFEPGARYDDNGGDIGPRTVSEDVTLDNCTSIDNGRSTYSGAFFLSGYYLSRNTTLTNCTAADNTNAGFYVHGGINSQFVNCTDTGSKKAGFLVIKGSSDITIENCISKDNPRFALWAAFTENLQVKNFHQINANSENYQGTQSILGWYKDDSRYQLPVTNSNIEIVSNKNSPSIINQAGSGNTYNLIYNSTLT
jgi:parallel beta-helix repeat protein